MTSRRSASSWMGSSGSSTAATTRPASRCSTAATLHVRRAAGRLADLESVLARAAARRLDRHRPHALGDPRRARPRRTPTPTPTATARSSSSTTASSRTTWSSRSGCRPRATRFRSETDTEVIAHLVEHSPGRGLEPERAPCGPPCARCAAPTRIGVLSRGGAGPAHRGQAGRGQRRGRPRRGRDVRRLRHPGDPRPHARRGLSSRTASWRCVTRRRRAEITTLDGRPVDAARPCASRGIRSWPRRAATGTSCSRRSTSSRARSPTRSGAAGPRGGRRLACPRLNLDAGAAAAIQRVVLVACGTSWHAALVGADDDRAAGRDSGRGRSRLGVPLPRRRSSAPTRWSWRSRSRARPPTPWAPCKAAAAQGRPVAGDHQRGRLGASPARRRACSTCTRARRSASPRPRRSRDDRGRATSSRSGSGSRAGRSTPEETRKRIHDLVEIPAPRRADAGARREHRRAGPAAQRRPATSSISGAAFTSRSRSRAR